MCRCWGFTLSYWWVFLGLLVVWSYVYLVDDLGVLVVLLTLTGRWILGCLWDL